MDGPNVNVAFAKKVDFDREASGLPQLLTQGPAACTLFMVHSSPVLKLHLGK